MRVVAGLFLVLYLIVFSSCCDVRDTDIPFKVASARNTWKGQKHRSSESFSFTHSKVVYIRVFRDGDVDEHIKFKLRLHRKYWPDLWDEQLVDLKHGSVITTAMDIHCGYISDPEGAIGDFEVEFSYYR